MPRKQRLVRERARRLAKDLEETPNRKTRGRMIAKAFDGHVKDIARAYTEVAMAELIKLATKSKSENMKLLASTAILERGWGKPAQAHVGGEPDDNPVRHVHEVVRRVVDPAKREDT
jgi:hypothetical protein